MLTSLARLSPSFHQRLAALAHKARLIRTPIPPYEIFVETTAFCNLKCPTCPQAADLGGRPKGNMDFDLFRKIIDDAAGWASRVSLFLAGEPLIYKRTKEAIEYASAKGLHTRIHSNILPLNEGNIDAFLNPALDELSISFDGPNDEHYDRIRVGGNFDACLKKTRWLLEEKARRGLTKPRITIQSIQLKGEDPDALLRGDEELLKGLAYDAINIIPSHSFAGYYKDGVRGTDDTPANYDACGMLYNRITVLWDGRVVACCNDFLAQYVTGDVHDDDLMTIWNGDRFRALRATLAEGRWREVDLCRECDAPFACGVPEKRPLWTALMRGLAKIDEAVSS